MLKHYLVLFFFGALLMTSCKKENSGSCEDVNCTENATCINGICACDEGYEGYNCDITSRDKFIGVWQGKDTCHISFPGNDQFSTTEIIEYELVFSDTASTHLHVNMEIADDDAGYTLYGTTHQRILTIPNQNQTISLSDLPADIVGTVSGNGRMNQNQDQIRLTLQVNGTVPIPNFGSVPANCNCSGVLVR